MRFAGCKFANFSVYILNDFSSCTRYNMIVLLHPNPSHFIHNSYVELFAAIGM